MADAQIAASPDSLRAASAAWGRARIRDDRFGDPDPGALAAWAESVERYRLTAPDLIAGVDRYYEGTRNAAKIGTGDLIYHAREIRRQRAEAEKAPAARALPSGDTWGGLPIPTRGEPIWSVYADQGAIDISCPNCGAVPGDACVNGGFPRKIPCTNRTKAARLRESDR